MRTLSCVLFRNTYNYECKRLIEVFKMGKMYFVTALVYYYALGKSVIVLTRKKYKVSVD